MKFQDKKKIQMMRKNNSRKALLLLRKGHLLWNMFNVMWAFSKRHASEAPTPS